MFMPSQHLSQVQSANVMSTDLLRMLSNDVISMNINTQIFAVRFVLPVQCNETPGDIPV